MKFEEIECEPEFRLTLSLQEMISLYRIVNYADYMGFSDNAKKFSDLLYEFGANSNKYNHLDWE